MENLDSVEVLGLSRAVRESGGRVTYHQLWRGIRAGRIRACQPSGPNGAYTITRAELEKLLVPTGTPARQ